ncbi:MAG TPA: YihY/virulence factor BrkB family protein [Bacteroidia bacterium]|nr:YihY/virulence factor BrkB family protein [Bacteroidia bacterium]
MAGLIQHIRNFWHFISVRIWRIRLSKLDGRQGFLIRQVRILILAIRGFMEDKCLTKATALTFYSLFSIVPILALVFAIAKGFGFEKNLEAQLIHSYPQYADILSSAFVYANSMLSNAKGGVIAGFGILLLLWSVLKLLMSIEDIFNEVWDVKTGRSWVRKLTDYLTVMLISPLLLIISGGLTVAIQAKLGDMHLLGTLSTILFHSLAYFLVAGVFTFLYIVMPNTKIRFKAAAVAGLVAMVLFETVQWAYLKFQIGANSMNAIYGGFAALPLFFIWVQYSWYVVLLGAEVAYAHQHADHYELQHEINNISQRYRKTIGLMVAALVGKKFYAGEKAPTAKEIADQLDLPYKLVNRVLQDFVSTGLFSETRGENEFVTYQPGVTESKFTVRYVLGQLDKLGVNELPINESPEYLRALESMNQLDQYLDNDLGNTYVRDLAK